MWNFSPYRGKISSKISVLTPEILEFSGPFFVEDPKKQRVQGGSDGSSLNALRPGSQVFLLTGSLWDPLRAKMPNNRILLGILVDRF